MSIRSRRILVLFTDFWCDLKVKVLFPPRNILTLKRRSADCFILRPSSYRAVNSCHLFYKTQSFYTVSGTIRYFSPINIKQINRGWAEYRFVECKTCRATRNR
jgi:hypothetical protein